MRRLRWLPSFACLLALGFLLRPPSAAASELSWAGPPDCDQREQLLFQVERALSAPLSRVAEFQFQVHVERTLPDARARLLVRTGSEARASERVLVAPSCSKLVDTLAVAMALAVEAAAEPAEPEQQGANAALASPAPAAPPSAPSKEVEDRHDVPPEANAVASRRVWRAALWLTGDSGSLPAPGLGAALGVELGWPRIQLRALATLWSEQHTQLARQPELGGDLSLATGALLGCTSPLGAPSDTLALSLCAGGEIGRLTGSGTGVLDSRQGHSLWVAARAEADFYWSVPASRLRLGAQLSLAVPFVRDDFVLDQIGAVHRPASLAARAGLGVDVAFE